MYALVRPFGRWAFRFWHRVEIEGVEHLAEPDGRRAARLFFSGHQNGLADPVFACVSLPRQMHYFTRADVFSNRVARWCILRMNMMPIYRPKDRVADLPERNQRTFDAAHQRLDAGAWCGIFPEAGHLNERRTRRFKHGSSRFLLGAMSRPAVRARGLDVLPMTFDFTRYEGYRSRGRIRIDAPISIDDLWANPEDNGPNRILLSARMRTALQTIAVELLEGPLYDAHLAICRSWEGAHGGRPDPEALSALGQRMTASESEVLDGFSALLQRGMPHPRTSDAFEGLGRVLAGRRTSLHPHVWRWPFWGLFRITTGWWPRILEPYFAKRVREVAFRTTFGIPFTLIGVGMTWGLLCLAVSLWLHGFLFGILLFGLLRLSQSIALPLEDALLDRRAERQAAPYADDPWVQTWFKAV